VGFLEGAPESVWNPPRSNEAWASGQLAWRYVHIVLKLILPSNDPSAIHQPPSVTPYSDNDTTPEAKRAYSPTQLFQLDHVCFPLLFPQT